MRHSFFQTRHQESEQNFDSESSIKTNPDSPSATLVLTYITNVLPDKLKQSNMVFHISPSAYDWLIPDVLDIGVIDEMALAGTFPTLLSLYPSFLFAILFGIIRSILQVILFKVS